MSTPEHRLHAEVLRSASYLRNPMELGRTLDRYGVFKFPSYASGLFPASDLSPEQRQATGMGMAWLRDNAHVAFALHKDGRSSQAARTGEAFLRILHNNRAILRGELDGRLPVRVDGDTLENDHEPRVQNDSVGYALWLTSRLINDGVLPPESRDLGVLADTVEYLQRIEYWHDADEGHWEEDRRIHASSIGVVLMGLAESQAALDSYAYGHDLDFNGLTEHGLETFYSILSDGVTDRPVASPEEPALPYPDTINPAAETAAFLNDFSINRRRQDAALLFLVEPLQLLHGEWAERIVREIEDELVRPIGVARYAGDTYWEPRFPDIMSEHERTRMAEGRTERRNLTAAGVAYTGTEAQWTLFDPLLSAYWGRRFSEAGDAADRDKQLHYLDRSLSALQFKNGSLQLPEANYYNYINDQNLWVPNGHMPLLWGHANLLTAVRVFEDTTF